MQSFKAMAKEMGWEKIIFFFLVALAFILPLSGTLRHKIHSYFEHPERTLLAVAMAPMDESNTKYQILKIKTQDGIYIEVYRPVDLGALGMQPQMVARTKLPDARDGYFTFNGEVTNLAVGTFGTEKTPKIFATSFDNNLVAHINVYQYAPGKKELELVHIN